jgi:hypothetical protein
MAQMNADERAVTIFQRIATALVAVELTRFSGHLTISHTEVFSEETIGRAAE